MISKVVSLVTGILVVPFIVKNVSIEGFGLWEIVLAISTLFASFQGSLSYITIWQISLAKNENDIHNVNIWFRNGLFFAYVQIILFLAVIYFFSTQLLHLFNVSETVLSEASSMLWWISLFTLLSNITETIGALLSSYNLSGQVNMVQSLTQGLGYLIMIVLLYYGFHYSSLVIGFVISKTLYFVILYFRLVKVTSIKSLLCSIPSKEDFLKVKSYIYYTLIGTLTNISRDQLLKLIISNLASTKVVGYYGIAARLSALIMFMCSFFTIPTMNECATLHGSSNTEGVKEVFMRVTNTITFISGFFTIVVAGFSSWIVHLWIGEAIPEVSMYILIILIGNLVAIIFTGSGSAVCRGIGKIHLETRYIVFNIIIYTILLLVMVPLFGFLGAIITSSLSYILSSLFFGYLLIKNTYLSHVPLKKGGLSIIPIVIIVILLQMFIGTLALNQISWVISFMMLGAATLLVFVIYYWGMFLLGIVPSPRKMLLLARSISN